MLNLIRSKNILRKNLNKYSRNFYNSTSCYVVLDKVLEEKINDKWKTEIINMSSEEKAYISGFLDGDGSLLVQIVKGNYKYGFTRRYTIQFVQSKKNHNIMLWLKSRLQVGNIRIRKDDISEYAITGKYAVAFIIKVLLPYLKIKKELGVLLLKIIEADLNVLSNEDFLKVCFLVDSTIKYTYGKKRKITADVVKQYFDSP